MLSEIIQTERQIPCDFTCMWDLTSKINKRETDSDTEIRGRQRGGGLGD